MYFIQCIETGHIIGKDTEGYPHNLTVHGIARTSGWAGPDRVIAALQNLQDWVYPDVFGRPRKLYSDYTFKVVEQIITYEVV